MIFPEFLQQNDRIGVTAPSAGIDAAHEKSYRCSCENLKKHGWRIRETANVRLPNMPSSSGEQRGAELRQLFLDDGVKTVLCAAGGDFLCETLPYVDFDAIAAHPKWVQGYSDPTGLLFPITTMLDIATIYGPNAGGFDQPELHPALENALSVMEGVLPIQRSFERWQSGDGRSDGGYVLDRPVCWQMPCGGFTAKGRLLGGCLDVLDSLRGTPYAPVPAFLERNGQAGMIWYFDVFAMTAEQVFYSLWSMKQAGWFAHAKAFLFGRVMFPGGMYFGYADAVRRALGDVPLVLNADIGHVKPDFTLINGAMASVTAENGRGTLEMELD